jgi:PBP1b-binding outer membrane lipoprotein LpoB
MSALDVPHHDQKEMVERDNYRGRKTMRRITLLLLTLLILASCSSPAATQIFASKTLAATTPVPTSKPTETPIPVPTEKPISKSLKFNPNFLSDSKPETLQKYSEVNLESFVNGTLLAQEEEYLQNNNIFTDEVIDRTKLSLESWKSQSSLGFSITANNINFPFRNEDRKNENTRPIKIFSYYIFYDLDVFTALGIDKAASDLNVSTDRLLGDVKTTPYFLIAAWAYHNPDKTVTLGHSFVDYLKVKANLKSVANNYPDLDYKFLPAYNHSQITFYDYDRKAYNNFARAWPFLENLWEKYPDLKPEKSTIDKWAKSGQMPKELETKLFTWQSGITFW